MKLKSIKLENFRGYKNSGEIPIDSNLTGFIGKNDAGKSSILEALDIFFNDSTTRKIDNQDLNVFSTENKIRITAIFNDLPENITVDESYPTTFEDEFLLNKDGDLEIIKEFSCNQKVSKATIFIKANHPTNKNCNNLHQLKINDLQKKGEELGLDVDDKRVSSLWRKAIWHYYSENLNLKETQLNVNKLGSDSEKIYTNIEASFPSFALFSADRQSQDADPEAKNPMQAAVQNALKEYEEDINQIKENIVKRVEEVANGTLEKLKEMNEELAKELSPSLKNDPQWNFNFNLDSDGGIPFNKRGSGVRRLVLLNFFRAEAENNQKGSDKINIIYAIEEPETSQHPDHQVMLMDSLLELANKENCQILLTTHVPALGGRVPTDGIRFITEGENGEIQIENEDPDVLQKVADSLGVLSAREIAGANAIIMVEGVGDVEFLKNASFKLSEAGYIDSSLDEAKIVPVITGGCDNLKHWITKSIAHNLSIEWGVLLDSDKGNKNAKDKTPIIQDIKAQDKPAFQTRKREVENYIHPRVLIDHFGVDFEQDEEKNAKNEISQLTNIKKNEVAGSVFPLMTVDQFLEMDKYEDENGEDKHELLNMLQQFIAMATSNQ